MCVCMSIDLSSCLLICLFVMLPAFLTVYVCRGLPVCRSITLYVGPYVRLFLYMFIDVLVCLSVSLYLPNCLNTVPSASWSSMTSTRCRLSCRLRVCCWLVSFDRLLPSGARLISRPVRLTNFDLRQQSADPSKSAVQRGWDGNVCRLRDWSSWLGR